MKYRPAGWLVNLTRLNPKSAWPWRHSIRTAVAVTLPILIGMQLGQLEGSLLISLGALLNSTKVQFEPYRVRFRNFFIVVPIAMAGFVLGELVAGHGELTLVLLILLGLISGLISGYGAVFSTAAMQMLMLAVIAASDNISQPFWLPPVLFASGAAFAAFLLAIEAAFDRHMPERTTLAKLLHSLAHLARSSVDPTGEHGKPSLSTPFEQQRRRFTDAMQKAYSGLLQSRSRDEGSTPEGDRKALFLSTIDMIFAAILAGDVEPDKMQAVAHWLDAIAAAIAKGRGRPHRPANLPEGTRLVAYIDRVVEGVWPGTEPPRRPKHRDHRVAGVSLPSLSQRVQALAARHVLGRDVVVSALQLALCLGVAFVAQDVLGGVRSYWIPLCVVIVLKPDFGSVFVRAVQRSLGTILGVAIGVVLLTFVPKGLWLLACMAVLAALIPPAAQRGYAVQCAVLTPLVLILIDMTVPGITVDFGPERLVDTLVGSAIVLVFGYLIWPRDPGTQIQTSFNHAMQSTSVFLRAAGAPMPTDAAQLPATQTALFFAAMAAYRSLSNVRTSLQRALAEPPPASGKAAAWFPAVVEAERLCDRITKLAQLNVAGEVTLDPADVERRVARLASIRGEKPAMGAPMEDASRPAEAESDDEAAFHEIDLELDQLARLMEPEGAAAK